MPNICGDALLGDPAFSEALCCAGSGDPENFNLVISPSQGRRRAIGTCSLLKSSPPIDPDALETGPRFVPTLRKRASPAPRRPPRRRQQFAGPFRYRREEMGASAWFHREIAKAWERAGLVSTSRADAGRGWPTAITRLASGDSVVARFMIYEARLKNLIRGTTLKRFRGATELEVGRCRGSYLSVSSTGRPTLVFMNAKDVDQCTSCRSTRWRNLEVLRRGRPVAFSDPAVKNNLPISMTPPATSTVKVEYWSPAPAGDTATT